MLENVAKEFKNVYELLGIEKSSVDTTRKLEIPERFPVTLPLDTRLSDVEEGQFVPKKEFQAGAQPRGFFARDYVKYPLIFVLSFVIFYVFLNSGALWVKIGNVFTPQVEPQPQTEGTVIGVATPEFNAWIGKYFFHANNRDSLSPNVDFDHDGLSNYQEFLIGTNPTKTDTDNDEFSDGQEILNGYNPLYQGTLTAKQQETIRDWNLVDVNNRISYAALTTLPQGPIAPTNEPQITYNLELPGEISIPRLGITAPLVWSKSPENFDADLNRGVIHYPGTSLPGQLGVTYISGHSSNYPWARSDYSYVFTRINELNEGDEFFVTIQRTDGTKITMRYLVFAETRYNPDDQAQFVSQTGESIVNLSTCWPIGSLDERYVVSGRLTGV